MQTLTKWDKLRYRIKRLGRDTGGQLGINANFLKQSRGARIVVYHGICRGDHLRLNTLFVNIERFEAQLKLYKRYFHLISLDDFYHRRFNDEKFNLCLSFDDGFANNYNFVLPLLEQYEIPAVFFITGIRDAGYDILWNDVLCIANKYGPASIVFRNEKFHRNHEGKYFSFTSGKQLGDLLRAGDFNIKEEFIQLFGKLKGRISEEYWLQMTKDQIAGLSRSKWATIGSHGYFHNDFANLPASFAEKEMGQSKQYLEDITGKEVKSIAFPYGSYTKESVTLAKKTGYSKILATDFLFPGDDNEELLRERLTINPFISNVNQMHANIQGNYK